MTLYDVMTLAEQVGAGDGNLDDPSSIERRRLDRQNQAELIVGVALGMLLGFVAVFWLVNHYMYICIYII